MADGWEQKTAQDVRVGERVRTASGEEITVSRIESPFVMREGMIAFIEDTPARWYKRPIPLDAPVETQPAD